MEQSRSTRVDGGLVERIINEPKKLSEEQANAVLADSKYLRIIAGAGAGKTETLTRRIAYLLLVKEVLPSEIVAFTFTERAARSMKERIYERVQQLKGEEAIKRLGEMYIGTIHAYGKRILEDHSKYGNYDVLDENQEMAFMMRHGWSLGLKKYGQNYTENCRVFLRSVNMVWGEMLDESKLEESAPDFHKQLKKYEAILHQHKRLTFGSMIKEVVNLLSVDSKPISQVQHLIVDEYQDIDEAQHRLIQTIGRKASVFVVGDPRQCIYQWRGSNETFFDKFMKVFPHAQSLSIRENRRSGKLIVQNANSFANNFDYTLHESMTATRVELGFAGLVELENDEQEAEWIAQRVQEMTKELHFSDIGILVRSVSTSAGPIIDALKHRKIPYIVGGRVGLFKREEAQAMGRIFAWFSEKGFWSEDPWSRKFVTGDALLSSALTRWRSSHSRQVPNNAREELLGIKRKIAEGRYHSLTDIFHDLLMVLGFKNLDYRDPNDAAVMANLGRFNMMLTDYETANRLGGRPPKWEEDLYNLCWFMATHALQFYEEQPYDDIRGIDAIQILTIHQAKGLEWPVVFLASTTRTRFPAKSVGKPQNWCGIPRDLFDSKRYEGDEEDERRLFYVAVTRPKDALFITYFDRMKITIGPSQFIDDCDKSVLTKLTGSSQLPKFHFTRKEREPEMNTYSAGEVVDYNFCPQMYLFRKVWNYPSEFNVALGFGENLHYLLRRAGELVKLHGYEPKAAAAKVVAEDFYVPFAGGGILDNLKGAAGRILDKYADEHGSDLRRTNEVEYRLEFPVHNATISGKVDVIMGTSGEMEVREYKTSEEAKTIDETAVQVRLYVAGLKGLGKPVTAGSVTYLNNTKSKIIETKSINVSEPVLSAAVTQAESVVGSIANSSYAPTPGRQCGRCDYRTICKWSAAAPS
jgi:DNA helicase-2/ATP-dependent DNA helicase PcrA